MLYLIPQSQQFNSMIPSSLRSLYLVRYHVARETYTRSEVDWQNP